MVTATWEVGEVFGLREIFPRQQTDDDGRTTFRVEALRCWLYVDAAGFARTGPKLVAPNESLDIELEPECVVEGRVMDEWGRGVRARVHAKVHARREPIDRHSSWFEPGRPKYETNGDGAFKMRGLARGERCVARAWSFGRDALPGTASFVAGEGPLLVRIPTDAEVGVRFSHPDRQGPVRGLSCRLERRTEGEGRAWSVAKLYRREVDTSRDRVLFRSVALDTYRVVARVAGLGCGSSKTLVVADGARRHDVIVALERGRTIVGRIVNAEREPVDARVSFEDGDAGASGVATSMDGGFTLTDMPSEDTSFFVSAPGYETLEVPCMKGETSVGTVVLVREGSK